MATTADPLLTETRAFFLRRARTIDLRPSLVLMAQTPRKVGGTTGVKTARKSVTTTTTTVSRKIGKQPLGGAAAAAAGTGGKGAKGRLSTGGKGKGRGEFTLAALLRWATDETRRRAITLSVRAFAFVHTESRGPACDTRATRRLT